MTLTNCRSLLNQLKQLECPDSTFAGFEPPLVFDRGLGSLVRSASGDLYIDLCAGFGVLALGHNPPETSAILAKPRCDPEQDPSLWPTIVHGMGDVYPSEAKVRLLSRLHQLLPAHLSRSALALSGSQAVEIAIKTAILATQKAGFIVFEGGYHGLDLGTLPLTTNPFFRDPFEHYLKPTTVSVAFGAGEQEILKARDRLESLGLGLAGILVEPIQGRAGVRPASTPWLESLAKFAKKYDGLLIFDEIFCGLGRSGWWTMSHEIPCDLLCLGKALGGGLPLSVCSGREKVMGAWPESRGEALHTGTFFGHPLACEMACATLEAIDQQNLVTRSRELGETLRAYVTQQLGIGPDGPNTQVAIRGQGLMNAISFPKPGMGVMAMDTLRTQGVIALVSGAQGESLSITPALNIPKDLLWKGLDKIISVTRALMQENSGYPQSKP